MNTFEPAKHQLINVAQAAQYTGLAPSTLYVMISQRRIPFVKVGRLVKFNVPALDDWLRKQTVMPMPDKGS